MILVTGATGLVGGNLMWHLLQENDRIVAIRRSTGNLQSIRTIFSFYTSTPDKYLACIDWKIADVLDISSIREAMHDISVIYHCAAVVSFDKKQEILFETNVTGTRNIVRVALENNINKFCFVSSIAACGEESGNIIDENSIWKETYNRSLYSKSKYLSEQEVWKGINEGLNAVIVNPGVILGISGTNSGSSLLFSQVKKGLLFYTNGGSGYVDVRDVVKVMIQLTNSNISGERFILVSDNCSNKEILCLIADGFGKRRPFIQIGRRTLWLVGMLFEVAGKVFHFHPLIDRGIARTATNREYYSNQKIVMAIDYRFTPVKKTIFEICEFKKKSKM